jgi:hypothetical protein
MRWSNGGDLRILDFDLECRPLHWYGMDYVSKEITAIGCKFLDSNDPPEVWLLGDLKSEEMIEDFLPFYNEADMVVGHYIRGYDLPTLAGAMLEFELGTLGDKLSHDTKLDLIKFEGLSKSQENLGSTLGLDKPKIDMNQAKWRTANRLEQEGLELAYERVAGDVEQNIELRAELLRRGLLGPPKVWRAGAGNMARYTA